MTQTHSVNYISPGELWGSFLRLWKGNLRDPTSPVLSLSGTWVSLVTSWLAGTLQAALGSLPRCRSWGAELLGLSSSGGLRGDSVPSSLCRFLEGEGSDWLSDKDFFFLNWSVIPLQCVLVSAVQRCESAICIHVDCPSWASFPPPTCSMPSI